MVLLGISILFSLMTWESDMYVLDSVSFWFAFMSLFMFICVLWMSPLWSISVLTIPVMLCFLSTGIISFFVLFEFILLPMLIYIITGKSGERWTAARFFLVFTLVSSIPAFVGLLMMWKLGLISVMIEGVCVFPKWLQLVMCVTFATKFPIFFLHNWLPRAHVEAPTMGSVVLAACLLKLGSYGMLRLAVSLCGLLPSFLVLSLVGSVISAFVCLLEGDLKSLVAFSSVSHMSLLFSCMAGLNFINGDQCVLVSIGHGYAAAGLFLLVGSLYEKTASRSILINRHMTAISMSLVFIWLMIVFINLGLPPSISIFPEFQSWSILLSVWMATSLLLFLSQTLVGLYSVWMYDSTIDSKHSNIVIQNHNVLGMATSLLLFSLMVSLLT